MRRVFTVLALMATGVFSGYCQTPSGPVTVKRLVLTNQSQYLGSAASPITLFTPTQDGFYRVTIYLGQQGECVSNGSGKTYGCTGTAVVIGPNQVIGFFGLKTYSAAYPVLAGQPISYYTYPPDSGARLPYDLIIVIEEL
jgi:hypothetical protein